MLWVGWWLLAFWVVVLAGLVGGKVFLHQARWQRRCYLVVLVYLLALLAILILPEIAPRQARSPRRSAAAAEYGLPVLLLALALMPAEPESPEAPQVIDFFYSVFLMLVLGVVILGSFTFMTLGRVPYLEALTNTVFLIAGTIFVLGLAWSPRTGYAGLNVFFSRYLFSIGLPVEKWLYFLAELSQQEARPERFLAEGVAGLARLPWIAGAAWRRGRPARRNRRAHRPCGALRRTRAGTDDLLALPHQPGAAVAHAPARASCWASSMPPSCASRSCGRRATCRRCTRPARA